MWQTNYKGRKRYGPKPILVGVILVLLAGLVTMIFKGQELYFKNHFLKNTNIQGVDCSYLSVDKAIGKISEELNNQLITLVFKDAQYEFYGERFRISLNERAREVLTSFLEDQKQNGENKDYTLDNVVEVSKGATKATLSSIRELQEDQMVSNVDASIKVQDDGTLAVSSEVIGTEIDFDEAVSLCTESIARGEKNIEFTKLIKMPNVLSNDSNLNFIVNKVNTILGTVINFEFTDGSIYTLDKETTKKWVTTDKSGNYYVDMENVNLLVEELNKRVQAASGQITFTPTGISTPITFDGKFKVELDLETEKQQIIQELTSGGEYTREPIYKENLETKDLLSYVEVDITRQMVWIYYNGECVLDTPCVTGKPPNHDTPTGIYYLTYKISGNIPLRGYNDDGSRYESYVSYWMPFNGEIGFHDANWQSKFGGDWYLTHGSHGCVNLPFKAAKTLYNYINSTMPIIVYCS